MIFNVLTKDLKDEVRKEYKLRRFVLYFLVFDIALVFFIILLIPSYVSVNISKSNLATDSDVIKNTKNFKDTDETIKSFDTTNKYLTFLAKRESSVSINEIIKTLLAKKNVGISISEILYSKINDNSFDISIKGLAKTRESLTSFTKLIADDKSLEVDLPVSNFTKDKDIEFYFSVIKHNEEKK